jgi:hypothetical protein
MSCIFLPLTISAYRTVVATKYDEVCTVILWSTWHMASPQEMATGSVRRWTVFALGGRDLVI